MRFRTVLIYSLLLVFCRVPAASAQKRILATVDPNASALNGIAEIYDPNTKSFSRAAGQMKVAREQHAAVLLNNGQVFIAGGYNNRYLKSAELFDPATGSFTGIEKEMITPRAGAVSALLPGGSVLLAGGYNGAYLATAEVYDPVEGSFSATYTAMSSGRTKAAAAGLKNGKVLVVGGYTVSDAGRGFLKTADIYDPTTREFTTSVSTMDKARELHTATLLPDGKVLIAGGCTNQQTGEIICNEFLDSAELYDPSTDKFTVTGSMNSPRMNHTATRLPDGRVLIAGGTNGSSTLDTAEIYDPSTGKFSKVGNMSVARIQHTASALPDGRVLIAGGSSGSLQYLDSAEIFDPGTGVFTLVSSPMTVPRVYHSATVLSSGKILLAGGHKKELLTFDVNYESTTDNISPNIVFSPDSNVGYVPYAGSGTVLAFSAQTGAELYRQRTGGKPASITPLPNLGALAVVSALENSIFILDAGDLSPRATYTFSAASFGFGSILTLSPDGNTGYISSTGTGEVIKFDVSNGHELGRLTGLKLPAQVAVTRNGKTLIVVDTGANEVIFADASSMTASFKTTPLTTYLNASLTIFNNPVLNGDDSLVAVGSQDLGSLYGTMFIIKTATGEIDSALTVGQSPGNTLLTRGGSFWVVLSNGNISVIPTWDPRNFATYAAVEGNPLGSANIVTSQDLGYVFYTSSTGDRLYQQNIATGAVVGSYAAGDVPDISDDESSSVAFTPDYRVLAVLNFSSNDLDLFTDNLVTRQTKFISQQEKFTGISVVNLSGSPANVTFTAVGNGGSNFSPEGIVNPATVPLKVNAQLSTDVSELFNLDTDSINFGHVLIESDQPGIVGFASTGQIHSDFLSAYLSNVQGIPLYPGPNAGLHDWIIPENPAANGATTELNFVNPNYNTAYYDVYHFGSDGTIMQTSANNSLSGAQRTTKSISDFITTTHGGSVLMVGGYDSESTKDTAEVYTAGTFAATTGAPGSARQGHTSTMLRNDQVLIAGGKNGVETLNTAVLYDPVGDLFYITNGTMNVQRYRHTATLLPNGKVLLAGGQSAQSINRTAELFDPLTSGFAYTDGEMTVPRDAHTATVLGDGKVLLTGGLDGHSTSATAETYDPATSSFSPTTGRMNESRAFHTAVELADGKIMIAGGYNGSYLNSTEIYDPATGLFTQAASMLTARSRHTATLLEDGKVLIAGGLNSSGTLNTAEIYDPASGQFYYAAENMTTFRSSHTATRLADGTVLIAGGYGLDSEDDDNDGNTSESIAKKSAERFDPDTWQFALTAGSMSTARQGHTATLLVGGKQGYLRVQSQQGVLFTEFYSNGGSEAAINGIDVNKFAGVSKIYSPQFAILPQYDTLLNIINANQNSEATVVVTLHAPDGTVLATSRSWILPINAQVKGDLRDLFENDSRINFRTGWLEVTSSVDRIVGTVTFTNSNNAFLSTFELSGTPMGNFVFPLVSENSDYATGVALLNSGSADAHVVLELWEPSGTRAETASITLPANSNRAQPLSGLFPGMQHRQYANLRIRSDQPLYGFALLYSLDLHFVSSLTAVPYPER